MENDKFYTNLSRGHIVLKQPDGCSIGWHAGMNKIVKNSFKFDRPNTWRESTLVEMKMVIETMVNHIKVLETELSSFQFKIKVIDESIDKLRKL